MKFQYSVIGDNTQENREWLENVGYKQFYPPIGICDGILADYNVLVTNHIKGIYYIDKFKRAKYPYKHEVICIGNSPLFKAVSAISTTTDIGKYYINNHTGQWKKCDYNMATDENIDWNDWTEATLTELQERFKEKER